MYQPKLYLRFDPPIQNDKVGIDQLNKILGLIENEYSSVYWFEGQSPSEFNPFADTEDEDIADQIKSLTIGHWPDSPDLLTYGQWDDNDMNYQNAIDGWQWLKDREVDYDQTSDIFSSLNENEEEIPKVTYVFEPPIEDEEILRHVMHILNAEHPGLEWVNGVSVLTYDIYNEVFDRNDAGVVGALSIGFFPEEPNQLSWSSWVDPDENWGPKVDGWSLIKKYGIPNTEDVFNQLNESTYQPKLNLRFDEPIYDANELDKVLRVLNMVYPGLQWKGGDSITTHNVIRDGNEGDFEYDPIYYLTIGFFPHAPDRLTYTNGPDDDSSYADDEHHNFNWVDGWQWVKDNEVNYDETTDIFNQLNESYDFLDQTNLKGFKFKKIMDNNPKLWVIRTVMNDDGKELYFKYDFSDAAEELLGSPDIYGSGIPRYGYIEKEKAINHVDNGDWGIIDMPTTDTEGIFNQLD
jgi:hypothetical protein